MNKMIEFTEEEIVVLKEMAQEKLRFDRITKFDIDGKPVPYRNRYSIDEPHLRAER
jgi:hypothetical protein